LALHEPQRFIRTEHSGGIDDREHAGLESEFRLHFPGKLRGGKAWNRKWAFIAEKFAPGLIGEDGPDSRGPSIHGHRPLDESRAMTVIHPRSGVAGVERLNGRAVGTVPAEEGDFARCGREFRR